ncbi:MAG: lysophospholipase, partial [Actinomycetia bacterium]|nr:lysophospholipase [Actinomycetes bacterium]
VIVFEALSHGASDDGPSGRGRAHGVEFGRALDDVVAKFGPAHAIIAHSMGAISALLALRDGWVGADRLVLIAPMAELTAYFDRFGATVGFGPRVRRHLNASNKALTGIAVEDFALDRIAEDLHPLPSTLVVHDRRDRETAHESSARFVDTLPDARLVSTDGLGHRRILNDQGVITAAVAHVRGTAAEPENDSRRVEPADGAEAVA